MGMYMGMFILGIVCEGVLLMWSWQCATYVSLCGEQNSPKASAANAPLDPPHSWADHVRAIHPKSEHGEGVVQDMVLL